MSILAILLAYLAGSIPCGLLLSKKMGEGDLRTIGSGNIGATNALRTGNKKLAALTLVLDLFKGTLGVLIAYLLAPEVAATAALAAVLGHIFPVWLKFKGGKGVATGLGVILGLSPLVFVLMIATWLGMFKWKRISSLSALTAYALAPLFAYLSGNLQLAMSAFVLAIIIFATHKQNIQRLLTGEEKPFVKKAD